MRIYLNDNPVDVIQGTTISALLTEQNIQQQGSAVAINQVIVTRERWSTERLQPEDNLLIFQVIAGG